MPLTLTTTSIAGTPNPSLFGQNVGLTVTVNSNVILLQEALNQGAGSSITVTLGSVPAVGNTLLAFGGCGQGPAAVGLPSGFTPLASFTSGITFGGSAAVGSRVVQAGDGKAWTFTKQNTGGSGAPNGFYIIEIQGEAGILTVAGNAGTEVSGGSASIATGGMPGGNGYAIAAFFYYFLGSLSDITPSGYATPGWAQGNLVAISGAIPASIVAATLNSTAVPGYTATVAYLTIQINGPTNLTGTIDLTDSISGTLNPSLPLVGGTATYFTSALSVTSHGITAVYSGDGNHATSTGTMTQVVNAGGPTTTTLSSDHNPAIVGTPITFTASVMPTGGGTPTGNVVLTDSISGVLVTLPLTGSLTYMTSGLAIGDHVITASYGGDGSFDPSSYDLPENIAAKYSTSAAVSSSLDPSFFGDAFILTIQVTSTAGTPPGSVDLADSILGYLGNFPLSGGVTTYSVGGSWFVASHVVTATYGETADYYGSSGSLVQLVLTPRGAPADLPGFALIASYSNEGDSSLPAWAEFSVLPAAAAAGEPIFIFWTSNNVTRVGIVGTNGVDSVNEVISTTGSGIYEVVSGFQATIVLACTGYDSGLNAVATQNLQVTIA